MTSLSAHFRIQRRYGRSVNLERDLDSVEALRGYVLTTRAAETALRILDAASKPGSTRAWTITGVYGAGKSSFSHFLTSLLSGRDSELGVEARRLIPSNQGDLGARAASVLPRDGFLCAVSTGRREPLAHTVIRALARGAHRYWEGKPGPRPRAFRRAQQLLEAIKAGSRAEVPDLPELARELAEAAGTGVLIVLDELGKVFEAAARSDGLDDLFLLQQLAELPAGPADPPVLVLGLLHQSFGEYADGLTKARQAEWEKVQGRFEDIPFGEGAAQMLRLVAEALESDPPPPLGERIRADARAWEARLGAALGLDDHFSDAPSAERIARLLPLHPLAAEVLPHLCARYAQNERSLFTFLASPEPHSFARFLAERSAANNQLPLLSIADLYDYFLDVVGIALYARPQFQRWAEVHGLIRDAAGGDPDEIRILKTVGTLNLVSSLGAVRARRALVLLALVQRPEQADEEEAYWSSVLDRLIERGVLTYRERIDELRIWEGSHHDVAQLVRQRAEADRRGLAEILAATAVLPPVVAQRESYRTGTLRYFERRFLDDEATLSDLTVLTPDVDGLLVQWAGRALPSEDRIPRVTKDGRPMALIPARGLSTLEGAAREVAALEGLERDRGSLSNDGVALREMRQRLALARRALEDALASAFLAGSGAPYWVRGERREDGPLSTALSEACAFVYNRGPIVWNELINRRELTSQGARARRVLIEAMLGTSDQSRLALQGHGPEVSMYHSVLGRTGIHRERTTGWGFGPPDGHEVAALWTAVEDFCKGANGAARNVDELYALLQAPPYGVKAGLIPVMLAAVLVHHADDVSVYRNGTFLPILGAEHFDILIKSPAEFALRHFPIEGLRLEVFQELQTVLAPQGSHLPRELRNSTVLGVVRPLTQFIRRLPAVTVGTRRISPGAQAVRTALLEVTGPEELLFTDLPRALGFEPFTEEPTTEPGIHERFRRVLVGAIRELHLYYNRLLEGCLEGIHTAFHCPGTVAQTREDLRVHARALVGRVIEPRLSALVTALIDERDDERGWLESVVMVIADRPADTWTDDNHLAFELNLSDLAQRFLTLYAMQEDAISQAREGFDARRVVITQPNGHTVQKTIWLDHDQREVVRVKTEAALKALEGLPKSARRAVAVRIAEAVLGESSMAEAAHHPAPGQEKLTHG